MEGVNNWTIYYKKNVTPVEASLNQNSKIQNLLIFCRAFFSAVVLFSFRVLTVFELNLAGNQV